MPSTLLFPIRRNRYWGRNSPALIRDGYTSFKVYMTYDDLKLDDRQMLDVLAPPGARRRCP